MAQHLASTHSRPSLFRMHPALSLDNLKGLPLSSRRVIMAACTPDLSALDMERFASFMEKHPEHRLFDLLPVYYVFLDPARIPSATLLESSSHDTLCTVETALLSIEAMFAIDSPPEAGADLWPRLWTWIQFVQLFREFLGALEFQLPTEEELYVGFLTFSREMSEYAPNEKMITSTPGFQSFVVRAWACLLQPDDVTHQESALYHVFLFLKPTLVEEIIDGAGGNIDDVAKLIMGQLALIAPDGKAPPPEVKIAVLHQLIDLITIVDDTYNETTAVDGRPARPLSMALISRGFIKELTNVALVCTTPSEVTRRNTLERCLNLLGFILLIPSGYRKLGDAIQSGLLHVIVAGAQRTSGDTETYGLRMILEHILAPATVYYYVLSDLGTAYFAVAEDITATSFRSSDTYGSWRMFERVFLQRLERPHIPPSL
ncbi:hypothetical protein B0H11DRAFT_2204795 [Mycena galericulata]|nr:hypothetical protein B0H11DRAFT_2204795 [Mycena galericulata]